MVPNLTAFLMLLFATFACSSASENEALRAQLLKMAELDQAARSADQVAGVSDKEMAVAKLNMEIAKLNVEHANRLKSIIAVYGWPGRSLVGNDAARAAWLIVQHADHDPEFQRRVLQILEPLVSTGEVSGSEYAYLWDRTHTPQRYGTQGECTKDGDWRVREIESPAQVDSRRAAAGLFPEKLEDYIQMALGLCRKQG